MDFKPVLLLVSFWIIGCGGGPHLMVPSDVSLSPGSATSSVVTYDDEIKNIFITRCGLCHGPGKSLPNWQDYQTAFSLKDQIYQRAVVLRTMPPPGISTITDHERELIGEWIQNGAPESAANPPVPIPGPTPPGPVPDPGPTPPSPPPDFTSIRDTLIECWACHTHHGNSDNPMFPRLAGQNQNYLETELKAFREHKRREQDAQYYMWGPANQSDQTIHLLALYFSTQTPTPNSPGDKDLARKGEIIFKNGIPAQNVPACIACHGDNARGSAIAPRLAGQSADYLIRQFAAFSGGDREEATVMPAFSRNLNSAEEQALANYLQGLK